jgi:AraC-like DNA-binding protein
MHCISVDAPPPRGRPSTRRIRAEIFREAAAIVDAEFWRDLVVEDVAERVASSPRQLRRAFAEVGGMTFRSFLTEVRMRRAAALLGATDDHVKEIARRVGYREAGAFTKAFRREYDTTPSEYRKDHRR